MYQPTIGDLTTRILLALLASILLISTPIKAYATESPGSNANSSLGPSPHVDVDSSSVPSPNANSSLGPSPAAGPESAALTTPQSPSPPSVDSSTWQTSAENFKYLASTDARLVLPTDNRLHITSGDVLLQVGKHCTITTPLAETTASRNSILYFKIRHGLEHIFVMYDDGPGSVTVTSEQHSLHMGPGEEAVLSDFFPKLQHLVADDIGRRRTMARSVGNDKYIMTSEFAIMHTFEMLPLMRQIKKSTDTQDHALKERIIKTAAVLNVVERTHGPYSRSHD